MEERSERYISPKLLSILKAPHLRSGCPEHFGVDLYLTSTGNTIICVFNSQIVYMHDTRNAQNKVLLQARFCKGHKVYINIRCHPSVRSRVSVHFHTTMQRPRVVIY